jgi:ATP-dependent Clp protease protease subunit
VIDSHEVLEGLLKRNVLAIMDIIDMDMYDWVVKSVLYLESIGAPDVEVRIDSAGGEIDAGLAIYDVLLQYKGNSTGVVYRKTHSIAAIILQACTRRVMLEHSSLLIHAPGNRIDLDMLENPGKLGKMKVELQCAQNSLYDILTRRTGKSRSVIRRQSKKDAVMNPDEALQLNLIDEIWISKQ